MKTWTLNEVAEEIDFDVMTETSDEGVGYNEYWGSVSFDSRPMTTCSTEGSITLSWNPESPLSPEGEFEVQVGTDAGLMTIHGSVKGLIECTSEIDEDGVEIWTATATFTYSGELTVEGDCTEPDYDEDDDSDYDYGDFAD